MARQDAQQQGAQHITGGMGAVTPVTKRRVGDQGVEGPGRSQILREKYQRALGY